MAINITAESFSESDIPDASTTNKGVTEILTTSEALIYTAERYNGFPLTPIEEYVVTNNESSYDLAEELLNLNRADAADIIAGEAGKLVDAAQLLAAGGGGGSSADIGDTILKDKTIGDADTDLITQLGTPFNPITYPVLAANPDYNKGKKIESVDSETETTFELNINTGARLVRVSPTLYYAYVVVNGVDSVRKSVDGGVTWTPIAAVPPITSNRDFNHASFDGVDKILFFSSSNVALFDINSETFITGSISIPNSLNILILHYNTTLNKWVMFTVDSNPFTAIIYTSADGITWNLEWDDITQTDLFLDDRTFGIPTDNNVSYCNGYYYVVTDKEGIIYSIPENDLRLSNELIVHTFERTLPSQIERSQIMITESGQMAYLASYENTGDDFYTIQVVYSNDGINWDNKFLKLPITGMFFNSVDILTLVPLSHNTYLISGGNSSTSDNTTGIFIITNDCFDSYTYLFQGSNAVNSYFYKSMSLIFEPTTSKIVINLPSGASGGAECDNLILDVTLSASDIYETKDYSNLVNGNSIPYVKGK